MKISNFNKILIALPVLIFSYSSYAEDPGFYVGGSLGYSAWDADEVEDAIDAAEAQLAVFGITSSADFDDDDLGWKVFAGYNINQYFAAEIGYVDLGEAEGTITTSAPLASRSNFDFDLDGFTFAGIVKYPFMPNFDVFGKVGGFVWDAEAEASIRVGNFSNVISEDEDGTDFFFGLGAEYEFTNNVGVRAEWERFSPDDADVDFFSLGVTYDF